MKTHTTKVLLSLMIPLFLLAQGCLIIPPGSAGGDGDLRINWDVEGEGVCRDADNVAITVRDSLGTVVIDQKVDCDPGTTTFRDVLVGGHTITVVGLGPLGEVLYEGTGSVTIFDNSLATVDITLHPH